MSLLGRTSSLGGSAGAGGAQAALEKGSTIASGSFPPFPFRISGRA